MHGFAPLRSLIPLHRPVRATKQLRLRPETPSDKHAPQVQQRCADCAWLFPALVPGLAVLVVHTRPFAKRRN